MERICEEWYKVYCETIRRYDPNLLILGDRNTQHLHSQPAYAMYRIRPYVDVLCVNAMGSFDVIYTLMEQITPHWDRPIHLVDTGAGVYTGNPIKSGYTSTDLKDFEHLYRGLMSAGVDHPQIIGMGWCGYYENSTRSGLLDCANDQPLSERAAVIKKANQFIENRYMELFQEFRLRPCRNQSEY